MALTDFSTYFIQNLHAEIYLLHTMDSCPL